MTATAETDLSSQAGKDATMGRSWVASLRGDAGWEDHGIGQKRSKVANKDLRDALAPVETLASLASWPMDRLTFYDSFLVRKDQYSAFGFKTQAEAIRTFSTIINKGLLPLKQAIRQEGKERNAPYRFDADWLMAFAAIVVTKRRVFATLGASPTKIATKTIEWLGEDHLWAKRIRLSKPTQSVAVRTDMGLSVASSVARKKPAVEWPKTAAEARTGFPILEEDQLLILAGKGLPYLKIRERYVLAFGKGAVDRGYITTQEMQVIRAFRALRKAGKDTHLPLFNTGEPDFVEEILWGMQDMIRLMEQPQPLFKNLGEAYRLIEAFLDMKEKEEQAEKEGE